MCIYGKDINVLGLGYRCKYMYKYRACLLQIFYSICQMELFGLIQDEARQ